MTRLQYSDKPDIIENILVFKNELLRLTLENNSLSLIQLIKGSKLFFENIELTDSDFKNTIELLSAKGYSYTRFRNDVYEYDELGIGINIDEGLLQSIDVYRANYYNDLENDFINYVVEDMKNNIIKFKAIF